MSSTCSEKGQTVPAEEAASSGLSPRPTARPASLSTAAAAPLIRWTARSPSFKPDVVLVRPRELIIIRHDAIDCAPSRTEWLGPPSPLR